MATASRARCGTAETGSLSRSLASPVALVTAVPGGSRATRPGGTVPELVASHHSEARLGGWPAAARMF